MKSNKIVVNTINDVMIKLFFLYVLYQLLLHAYFSLVSHDPRLLIPHVIAYLHDIALLGIVTAIGYFATAVSPAGFRRTVNKAGSVFITIVGILLASYPKVLREYLAFPVNIFESDLGSAKILISDYLGITALLPALIALILSVLVLFTPLEKGIDEVCGKPFGQADGGLKPPSTNNVRGRSSLTGFIPKVLRISNKIKITGLIIILLIFAFTLRRPSPQPFVFSLQKKIESIIKNEKRAVPSLTRSYSGTKIVDDQNALTFSTKEITKYKHIVLIVMEGVTSKDFEKEFLTISNGFYQQNKSNAVYYKNYYATNLDSYTSLISMLTSVQVPYRAYADESLFKNVNTAPSITQDLHNRGFCNIFISTYECQPFVPTRSYWDKIYERKDLTSINNWLSLGSNRMESATEDKAAISTIMDNIKLHDKTFVLHEMVYGHSPEWRAKTGMTQLSYYNEYLMELSESIKEENLLSKTLFIIVSDHGDRAKSSEIDNYRVPLLVVGDSIPYQSREELLTHLELPEIIYFYAASDDHPTSSEGIFFVGSTEKWVYGKMNRQNEYLFIDNASGTILSQKGGLIPIEVRNEFQNHLDGFNAKYGVK
ncbi:MAG: hypothetical protein V1715_12300 [bacterium]